MCVISFCYYADLHSQHYNCLLKMDILNEKKENNLRIFPDVSQWQLIVSSVSGHFKNHPVDKCL